MEYNNYYDDLAASYIQVMSLRESQTSNDQAKRLGQITLIASPFVPVSLVSGVFSMDGRFAPGGDRFWVFVVVVVPIILFVWLSFFTRVGPWAKKLAMAKLRKDPPILPVYGPLEISG
jgi:Mg2+ and Co2+ transporter CorA